MPSSSRLQRASFLLVGVLLGLLLLAVGVWVYFRTAQYEALSEEIAREIGVPAEALEVERISPGEPVRIALRDVAVIGPAGDTIVAVPRLRLGIQRVPLTLGSPIVVSDVEVIDPLLRLVQRPDGMWNVGGALRVEAGGEAVATADEEPGRPLLLRDVRVVDGRVLIATPWQPADTSAFRFAARNEDVRPVRVNGVLARVRRLRDLDARLPLVRVGGEQGWRIVVAALTARLVNPDVRIVQLQGEAEATPEGSIRFTLDAFRTPDSFLEGAGVIRLAEGRTPRTDLELRAQPLAFGELRWLVPSLPAEGEARLTVSVETQDDGRSAISLRDVNIAALDSRVTGNLSLLAGGEAPAAVTGGELLLDPVDLRALEALGLEERFPFAGEVRGTVGAAGANNSALAVNLRAAVVPRGVPDPDTSVITAEGAVALGGGSDALFRLQDFTVGVRPFHLAALRPLFPDQQQRLQGELRGLVALSGTPQDLRIEDGEMAWDVGTPAPTRLAGISGRVTRDPELRYDLRLAAEPLALATLSELFPALPFRTAQLAGPIEIAGTADSLRFALDLRGDAGSVDAVGRFALADPLRFDVSGKVDAFRTVALAHQEFPAEEPVSGTFAARGTLEDFRFDVDLAQPSRRFALNGRVRRPGGETQTDVAGEVSNFRVGTLVGRPGLLAAPVGGTIRVDGGGRQPFRFDVDLRAAEGAAEPALLDVEGWFAPGDVPRYAAAGAVAGLDLRNLPLGDALPRSNLAFTVDLAGSGTRPENLNARFSLAAGNSTVAGLPLDAAVARLTAENGVLRVDTLLVALGGARLTACGVWGLERPAPEPLRFTLNAPRLASLAPLLAAVPGEQPQLEGSLFLDGRLGGSLSEPAIATTLRGSDLRYGEWRARSLTINADLAETSLGWTGEATLAASGAILAGRESFEAIRFQAVARPQTLAVGLSARRDDEADIALSGVADLTGGWEQIRGVSLESFALRLGGSTWQLAGPTQLRWGGIDGIAVDSLVLRRGGEAEGFIAVDGRLPPTGTAELRVQAAGIDLGEMSGIVPSAPEIDGVLALNAVVEGPVNAPELSVQARIEQPRFRGAAVDTISLTTRYADGRMETTAAVWAAEGQAATAEANVPLLLSLEGLAPSFEPREDEPMSARLVADSLPLGFLIAALPQASDGTGFFTGELRAGGTPGNPELTGAATVSGGALTLDLLDVRYTDINGRLSLENDLIRIDSLSARSGGTATLAGTVQVDDPSQPQLYLTATLNEFQPIGREELTTVEATGRLALSGRLPTPVLTGRVILDDGTISVPGVGEPTPFEITDVEVGGIGADTIPIGAAEPSLLEQIRVDALEVAIGEGVWVQSANDARVQIGGELLVYRAGEDLRVYGDLLAQRGTYTLRVGPITREFDVVSGQVRFFGTPDLNPSLDITAAHRVRTATVTSGSVLNVLVQITGTVQSPRIQLTSDTRPPLPESELLSYLIFGRPSFELGGATNRLAEELIVQDIAGGLVLGPVEQALLRTGLFDYVRIRGRPTAELENPTAVGLLGSTAVELGKELASDVFFTIECGVAGLFESQNVPACGTSLDWQINNEWSSSLSYEPLRRDRLLQRILDADLRYQFSSELRRRWEYGRPRGNQAPAPQVPEQRLPGRATDPRPPGGAEPSPVPKQREGAPR